MAADERLRVWTYSRANGALPPALQNHFVPDRHLGWHLGHLPDRVLAILTHREAQVVATRQVEEELRTTAWVVGARLPNGTELYTIPLELPRRCHPQVFAD
jgi:hypothetical protein